jgi:hypothetical protein
MAAMYDISFMSANSGLPFLETSIGQGIVFVSFSFSTVLFVLSMPNYRRKVMKIPFAISIVMTASISIYYFVEDVIKAYYSAISILAVLHILCILFFGLYLGWFAVLEKNLPEN